MEQSQVDKTIQGYYQQFMLDDRYFLWMICATAQDDGMTYEELAETQLQPLIDMVGDYHANMLLDMTWKETLNPTIGGL